MARTGFAILLGAAAASLLCARAAAQTSAEVRGGLMVGSHSSTAAGLDWAPELAYEVRVVRRVGSRIALTGGYVRTAFGCEEGFCRGSAPAVTGHHAALGAELSWRGLWGRVGALYGVARVGREGERPQAGPGLEAGAGLRIRVGPLRIGPGLSWRRMSANTPSSSDRAIALGFDLGVGFEFD